MTAPHIEWYDYSAGFYHPDWVRRAMGLPEHHVNAIYHRPDRSLVLNEDRGADGIHVVKILPVNHWLYHNKLTGNLWASPLAPHEIDWRTFVPPAAMRVLEVVSTQETLLAEPYGVVLESGKHDVPPLTVDEVRLFKEWFDRPAKLG